MAFSFRTPAENLVHSLPSRQTEELSLMQVDRLVYSENRLGQHLNFHLSTELKKFFVKKGIYLSPNSWVNHSHPGCKTIENWFLYGEFPSYIESVGVSTVRFISLRKGKLKHVCNLVQKDKDPAGRTIPVQIMSFNRDIVAKDKIRYSETDMAKRIGKDFNELKKTKMKDGCFFVHDELHYWDPKDLITFFDNTEANTIIGTVIAPAELLSGKSESFLPSLYQFKVRGKSLFFFPDGNKSEMYEQPSSCVWYLKTKYVTCPDGVLSLSILRSIGPFHLFIIRKGRFSVESRRFFNDFSIIDICGKKMQSRVECKELMVRGDFFRKIVMYIKSLKKPDKESVIAKLRMMSEDEINFEELLFLDGFCQSILKKGINPIFDIDFITLVGDWIKGKIPVDLQKQFMPTFFQGKSNTEALLSIKELEVEVELIHESGKGIMAKIEELLLMGPSCLETSDHGIDPICPYFQNYNLMSFNQRIWDINEPGAKEMKEEHTSEYHMFRPDRCVFESYDKEEVPFILEHFRKKEKIFITKYDADFIDQEFTCNMKSFLYSSIGRFEEVCELSRKKFKSIWVEYEFVPIEEGMFKKYWSIIECGPFVKSKVFSIIYPLYDIMMGEYPKGIHSIDRSKGGSKEGQRASTSKRKSKITAPFKVGSSMRMMFYISFGIYCPHKVIDYSVKVNSAFMNKMRIDGMLDYNNRRCKENEIVSNEDIVYSFESRNMDLIAHTKHEDMNFSLNFEKFNNACVFKTIKKILGTNDNEFLIKLGKMSNNKWGRRLVEDIGLVRDEAVELVTEFGIKAILFDSEGVTIAETCKDSESETQYIAISDNHCDLSNELEFSLKKKKIKRFHGGTLFEKNISANGALKLAQSIRDGSTGVLINPILSGLSESYHNREGQRRTGSKREKYRDVENRIEGKKLLRFIRTMEDEGNTELINSLTFLIQSIMGFAGSGKSKKIQEYVNETSTIHGTVIVPRILLQKDWLLKISKAISEKRFRVITWERALVTRFEKDEMIIIDEISLFPSGFISLVVLSLFMENEYKESNFIQKLNADYVRESISNEIIVMGDHLQARYFNESDFRKLDKKDEVDWLLEGVNFEYLNYSRRISSKCNFKIGVKFMNDCEWVKTRFFSSVENCVKLLPSVQILVASQNEKERWRNYNVITYGESQGLTFESVAIVLSPNSIMTSKNQWLVALTRSSGGVHFILSGYDSPNDFLDKTKGNFINMVINEIHMNIHDEVGFTTIKLEPTHTQMIGHSQLDTELKLDGDPWLKSYIHLNDEVEVLIPTVAESVLLDANPKIHLPIEHISSVLCEIDRRLINRELREFRGDQSMSTQFEDNLKKGEPGFLLSQAKRFQSIYPKHSNSDSLTFLAAVRKRLHFSSPMKEREKYESLLHLGEQMLEVLCEKIDIDFSHSNEFLELSYKEYVEKKTSKSGGTIAAHCKRSEYDWKINDVFLFMKTQLCTKYEKRFVDAKAGQTLACFSHVVLNRFAGPCRYVEKKISAALGDNFYIHQKKNFDELNKWVIESDFSGLCTESDYEAFDASQDNLILAFEYKLLRKLGWDDDLLNDYLDLKFNLGCRLGNLAVMRFTGEFGTFLFNTLANMVFTFMFYEIPKNVRICFAGDDMCANQSLKKRQDKKYESIMSKLSLKAKVDFTAQPTFCGWRLTKHGLFKKPELILERTLIAIEKGNFHQVAESYLLEASYAYKLGEWLFKYLSEKELIAHYLSLRKFVESIHLVRGKARLLISEQSRFLLGCQSLMEKNFQQGMKTVEVQQIASRLGKFTRMMGLQRTSSLTWCTSMNAPYQSKPIMEASKYFVGRQSLILNPLSELERKESTSTSMLVQFPSQYTSLVFMILTSVPVHVLSLIGENLTATLLLQHLTLTLQVVQLKSYSTQTATLTSRTSCLQRLVRSISCLIQLVINKAHGRLQQKLEVCTDSVMVSIAIQYWGHQDQETSKQIPLRQYLEQLDGTGEKWMILRSLCKRIFLNCLVSHLNLQKHQSGEKGKRRNGWELGLEKDRGPEPIENLRLLMLETIYQPGLYPHLTSEGSKRQTHLGQVTILKKESHILILSHILDLTLVFRALAENRLIQVLAEMSSEEERAKKQRADQEHQANQITLVRMKSWADTWTQHRDWPPPEMEVMWNTARWLKRTHWYLEMHRQFPHLQMRNIIEGTGQDHIDYVKIVNDYFKIVFGAFAVYSFSDITVYPNRTFHHRIFLSGSSVPTDIPYNLHNLKNLFRHYLNQSNESDKMNMKWRQLGKCFAEDIKDYLKNIAPDTKTWLYQSYPQVVQLPYLGVDTNTGLLTHKLTIEEKRAVTRVEHHLKKNMRGRDSVQEDFNAILE